LGLFGPTPAARGISESASAKFWDSICGRATFPGLRPIRSSADFRSSESSSPSSDDEERATLQDFATQPGMHGLCSIYFHLQTALFLEHSSFRGFLTESRHLPSKFDSQLKFPIQADDRAVERTSRRLTRMFCMPTVPTQKSRGRRCNKQKEPNLQSGNMAGWSERKSGRGPGRMNRTETSCLKLSFLSFF
jgi:hypothetical protein